MIDVIIIYQEIMNFIKKILIFVFVFYVVVIFLFLGLRRHRYEFSIDKLEAMIDTVSELRDKTNDLCAYSLYGDPVIGGESYIKLEVNCLSDRKSLNSLSLVAVDSDKLKDIIIEFCRIINFDFDLWQKQDWRCFVGDKRVDFGERIENKSLIRCYQGI